MELIFWLNTKTGVIYNKAYCSFITYEVGQENQFGHVVLAICVIRDKKLFCGNNWNDLIKHKSKETIKTKLLDSIIYKLQKIRGD